MTKIKSIMLIDDNEVDRCINQKVIESLNFIERILPFDSARDALNYLKLIEDMNPYHGVFHPQIILLDINMPVMDGFAFLDEFGKLEISNKIILPFLCFLLLQILRTLKKQIIINMFRGLL